MATNLKSKAMEHIQEGCKNPLIKLLRQSHNYEQVNIQFNYRIIDNSA